MKRWLHALVASLLTGGVALGDDDFPKLSVGAVLDARVALTGETPGWLDGGLGKTRYGGAQGSAETDLRLSQASLLLGFDLSDAVGARAQVNLDAEPGAKGRHGRVDLIEAFVHYRPALSPSFRLKARAGMFFPPISLEHTGPAWTTVYTITPSAANAWIGEEVRATGAELTLGLVRGENEVSGTGGVFYWNDPAGSLLAWRGWALHDRQTGLGDRLPLAPLPTLGPGNLFAQQPLWVGPLHEVDHRPGYYAGGSASIAGRVHLRVMRWDNRTDDTAYEDSQYGWATRFTAAGLRITLPRDVELLAQHLRGRSTMGRMPDGAAAVGPVPVTSYGLVTKAFGRHRLTVRYDRFEVTQQDAMPEVDDNSEDGSAWTAAYQLKTGEKHRVALEVLRVESTRPARRTLGLPAHAAETAMQASFRLRF